MPFITFLFIFTTLILFGFGMPALESGIRKARDGGDYFIIFMFSFVVCAINFGLIGGSSTHYEESKYVQEFEYSKLPNGVTVSFDNPNTNESEFITYEDTRTYNTISDTSYIKVIEEKNIYGFTIYTRTKVVNEKETKQ